MAVNENLMVWDSINVKLNWLWYAYFRWQLNSTELQLHPMQSYIWKLKLFSVPDPIKVLETKTNILYLHKCYQKKAECRIYVWSVLQSSLWLNVTNILPKPPFNNCFKKPVAVVWTNTWDVFRGQLVFTKTSCSSRSRRGKRHHLHWKCWQAACQVNES